MSDFRPAWWLPGPHLQTTWGRIARPKRAVPFRRETLLTPDDDDLLVDHAEPAPAAADPAGATASLSAVGTPGALPLPAAAPPHVVLLHGLEGSSHSVYIQGMARLLLAAGAPVSVMNFRGCARDPARHSRWLPNRGRRLYHSGETTDLDFLFRTLAARHSERRLAAIGVSLGGNVLLKWLGESAADPGAPRLVAAATLSVPYDLAAGARGLESGVSRHYVGVFLRTLREKLELLLRRHPDLSDRVDRARARAARTFFEFDDAATAPLHGFAGADDYYARSSSLGFLGRIATPTLCVSAADDPFLPRAALQAAVAAAADNPRLALHAVPHGGHAGFVAGALPGRAVYWGEERVVRFVLAGGGGAADTVRSGTEFFRNPPA